MAPNFWPERLRLDEFRRSRNKQERAEFERKRRHRSHTRRAVPAALLEWAGYVDLIADFWASSETGRLPEAWWWRRLPIRGQIHDDFRSLWSYPPG